MSAHLPEPLPTRAPRMPIETASERRIARELESAEPPYGWLPLAPDVDDSAASRRAIIAWAFGGDQDFGAVGNLLELALIVGVVALLSFLVFHNFAPYAWRIFTHASTEIITW